MNSRYAFQSSASSTFRIMDNAIYFEPGQTSNRPPYEIVELIDACVITATERNQIIVKTDLQPSNYYSNDNLNTMAGILHYASSYVQPPGTDDVYRYECSDSEKPKYIVSNLQPFRVFLTGLDGSPVTPGEVVSYMFLFKISYPDQGSITRDYVKAIPNEL